MYFQKLLTVLHMYFLIPCFPKNNIENIPKGAALRLRRICDSDKKI